MKNIKQTSKLSVLFMLISILIISCAPQTVDEPASEPGQVGMVVTMSSGSFLPAQITIEAGTTVRWDNTSNIAHTVTSGMRGSPTGIFNVTLEPGESFSFTFEEPGTMDYYCIPHFGMDGIVIVE